MNILVLMCDHHRFDALSCLGNPLARTPNLDRLAARSVRFANCYTQAPVCGPARHSLASGQYVHAHGVLNNNQMPKPGMVTIAHALAPRGYRCMQLGHMHWSDPDMDTGYEPWVTVKDWQQTLSPAVLKRYEWESQSITRRTTGGPSPRTREEYSGHYLALQTIQRLEATAERGEPFLCWTAFSEPHPPFYPPRDQYESIDQSKIQLPTQPPPDASPPHEQILAKRREWAHLTEVELRQIIAGYYGMVALVDEFIGAVLDALDRLDLAKETIVIWTTDHGDQMGEHGMFLKFNMREASVHVPLLIADPRREPGVRPELVEHIDVLPTLCELVGTDCPDTTQGRSLVSLLDGSRPASWRDAVFSQIGNVQMVRTERWKLNVYDGVPGELFDMQGDPDEFCNRIGDPTCGDTIRELAACVKEWERGV